MLTALALLAAAPMSANAPPAPPAPPVAAPVPPFAVAAPPAPLVALPPLPPVDPARLALARVSAGVWFRDGSMARIFDNLLSSKPDSYASSMLDLTMSQVMAMAGMPWPGAKTGEPDLTLRQMMAKNDPLFEQRMGAIHDAALAEIIRLAPRFEPQVRDGLSQSMARRFSAAQLNDMNRFLTSPSGQAFADNNYLMWLDPAVFRTMLGTVPGLVGEMPGVMARVKAASDRFPFPKPVVKPAEPAPRAVKKPMSKKSGSRHRT